MRRATGFFATFQTILVIFITINNVKRKYTGRLLGIRIYQYCFKLVSIVLDNGKNYCKKYPCEIVPKPLLYRCQ